MVIGVFSRTRFPDGRPVALRFKELLGETPLEYLTNWRMYKATGLLHGNDRKLFEVAKSVGYDSDAAFSKAFKRVLGMPPREYRQKNTTEAGSEVLGDGAA